MISGVIIKRSSNFLHLCLQTQ